MAATETNLLCVNVGNTNITLALSDGERILEHWRIRTQKDLTVDETAVAVERLFALKGRSMAAVTHAAVTSVVPALNRTLEAFFREYLRLEGLFVSHETDTGMPIHYRNPAEVGSDRIVNAVGAYTKYRRALIAVDLGTATTFDCVSTDGAYLGGAIAPGLVISIEALSQRGSKLPKLDRIVKPTAAIAKDTVTSMNSGILFGYAGLVDSIVRRMKQEMGTDPIVIVTGGIAPLIADVSETIDQVEPLLTLEGLMAIFRRIRQLPGRTRPS